MYMTNPFLNKNNYQLPLTTHSRHNNQTLFSKVNNTFTFTFNSNQNKNKLKSELCIDYINTRKCKFGEKCFFAHGLENLKNNKKTTIKSMAECRSYKEIGFCPYGKDCGLIHKDNKEESLSLSSCLDLSEICKREYWIIYKIHLSIKKKRRLDVFNKVYEVSNNQSMSTDFNSSSASE